MAEIKFFKIIENIFLQLFIGLPVAIVIRLMRPIIIIRIGQLHSWRIGHFAANTELALCERDAGIGLGGENFYDFFYFSSHKTVCNQFLANQWKRKICVVPELLAKPVVKIGQKISLLSVPEAGKTIQHDRDILGLYDRFPAHLQFEKAEIQSGWSILEEMGVPLGSHFVCLTVRDPLYLSRHDPETDYSYHDFRNSDVDDYKLAAISLAEMGFYVLRMGKDVEKSFDVSHPRVIDYATSSFRSDFMDVFLGGNCFFCITQGTGFDAIPIIFRKPVVQVNAVPVGIAYTFLHSVLLFKHHYSKSEKRELVLREIVSRNSALAMRSDQFMSDGVLLVDNSPEEIRDAVLELARRLNGEWVEEDQDSSLQDRFWNIYPVDLADDRGIPLHGPINARYSATFLRENSFWLE